VAGLVRTSKVTIQNLREFKVGGFIAEFSLHFGSKTKSLGGFKEIKFFPFAK